MRGSLQYDWPATADAYMAWWSLAGVDCAAAEAPVNWLRPATSLPYRSANPKKAPVGPERPWSLADYAPWALADPARPERAWTGAPIMPAIGPAAPLMIVSDMPDPQDMTAGDLFAGPAGQLLDAMLRAIGVAREETAITSLFFSRPPGGMVEAGDLEFAADRLRTLLSLAMPARVLLLGDRTARALMPSDGADGLRSLNHHGGTVPAVATFHPRLLLGQPAAKAECWRMLVHLIEDQTR